MLPRKLFTPKSWQIWLNKKDLARTLKIVSVISIALLAGSGQIASAATCTSSSFLDPKIVAASLTSTISADVGLAAWLFGTALIGFIGFSRRTNQV